MKCKQLLQNIWIKWVSYYFNGTGWTDKTNPTQTVRTLRTKIQTKRVEGSRQECSTKGKKEDTVGRVAIFFVAIAYEDGFIGCQQYEDHVISAY